MVCALIKSLVTFSVDQRHKLFEELGGDFHRGDTASNRQLEKAFSKGLGVVLLQKKNQTFIHSD